MKKWSLLASVVATLLAGCNFSHLLPAHTTYSFPGRWVPLAEMYPQSFQHKLQAAHHWDLLAKAEAAKINELLKGDRATLYIEQPAENSGDFHRAYHDLLTSHLVSNGRTVLVDERLAKTNDAYTLKYSVKVVQHRDRFDAKSNHKESFLRKNDMPFEIKLREKQVTPTEVLVTTQIQHQGRLLMSDSMLYYLNTGDTQNYTITQPPPPLPPGTVVKVVSVE